MARLRSGGLVLLFIAAMTLVQAATLFKDKSYMRQAPRQLGVGQGASTSTFNYWWPYPAWTATATTSTAGMATTTLLPIPATTSTGILATLSVPSSDSSSILTFSGTLTTLSDTLATSLPASSPSSSSPSASSSSPTSTYSNSGFPSRRFFTSPHFLVPLLAAVSGTAVLSVLLCLICRHRRRARTSSSSFLTEGKGWQAAEEPYHRRQQQQRGWWSGLFRGRDEFEETVPGPEYVGVEEDLEGPEKDAGQEQGGRLDIASWAAEAGGHLPKRVSTKGSGTTSDDRPLLSSAAAAPSVFLNDLSDEEEDDDDDDENKPEMQVPWESLRHKSIKRAILAKVDEEKRWTDSVRGVRAARAVRAVAEAGTEEMGASRSRSRSTRDDGQGRKNEGFRIVVESPPLRITTPGSSASGQSPPWSLASAFPFPFPLFSNGYRQREGEEEEEDKYTPVPTGTRGQSRSRRWSSPRHHQQQRQKQVLRGQEPSPGRARPAYRPSPSVLRMRSPPSVMTPQMESALCFTPAVGASARMGDAGGGGGGVNGSSGLGLDAGHERSENEGTIYTKTYRDRADRAIRRVEAIVESARVRNWD